MIETREQWLNAGIAALRPLFIAAGYTVPDNVRVTCGFPSKGALPGKKGSYSMGQCWADTASDGKMFEVFISPLDSDVLIVLATLVHELVHATVGLDAKHGKLFKACALAVGLEGKMRSTHAGEELRDKLQGIAKDIGAYPHDSLKKAMTDGTKKQTTRLKKCECGVCGYTVRVTAKWLEMGAPLCPNESCDDYRQPLQVEGDGE